MNNPETDTTSPARSKVIPGIIIFLSIFIASYLIMSLLAPGHKMEELINEYSFRQDEKNLIDERIFSDSSYLILLKEKAFLQSAVAMAETDSIYLVINLADSTANLGISGVYVHHTRINSMKISKILRTGNDYVISTMLSKPLSVVKEYSSIEKEPLMLKIAPRDTSEYQPDIVPDTADYEPVNFIIETNNGILIHIYQSDKLQKGDGAHIFFFDLRHRMRLTLASLKRVLMFKIPEYHPFIKLQVPRDDAKIIYRALPEHGQITIYR